MMFALAGPDDEEEPQETLAHRFCAFAMKTLNEDMDPLFQRFLPMFDQDHRELVQQGETHEQYAAYREYVGNLEEHVSDFALQEGFSPGDGGSFLLELQKAIEDDKAQAEKQVQAFLMHMEQQRRMKLGPEAPPMEEGEKELMKSLFRPQTVEDMMQMLLHMTEYTAFSSLMRAKVKQQKFMRELERRKKELLEGEMGLAHRFIRFAMKLLNDDLHEFYTKCMHIFDQEVENLQQQGHTHAQYAAFQEYSSIIERRLLEFCHEEGFGQDAQALFNELSRLIEKDQEEVAAQLRRVLADVEAKKEQLRTRATEGDSEKPLVLICKPSGLSDLMNSLIQQLEYHNFSASMSFRVEQDRMMKTILASFDVAQDAAEPPPGDLQVVDVEIDETRIPSGPPEIGAMSVTVPEGCEAGSQMNVSVADGQISVTVPGGLSPGMSFEVPCARGYAGGYAPKAPN